MEAVKEITVWADGTTANHTYLLDGDKMVAYIKKGTSSPFYFKSPIKGFSRSGRKFETLKTNPFTVKVESSLIEVKGSKGNSYFVDPVEKTCTCPGYTFRGKCKHTEELT
jgi:hypothetical protein